MTNSQSVCIGRFLVDLPADAQVSDSTSYQRITPHKPVRVASFAKVQQQIDGQAKAFRTVRMIRDSYGDELTRAGGGDPDKEFGLTQLVGLNIDVPSQEVVLGYHPDLKGSAINTVIHKVIGQWDYVFDTQGFGADDYPKTLQALEMAAAQFQPRVIGEMPRAPGFCFDGGMFADAGKPPVLESFTLVVTFPTHPDVRFVIDARTIVKVDTDEPSLKFRANSELAVLRTSIDGYVGVLARGELNIATQDGYQIAISAPYDRVPNTRMLKFFWSADGVPNDVTRPFMEIDMTVQPTDDGKSTIKDDAQAKALWNELIQGVRIRPGSV
ncbi:T6SS immunity protein Tli4 family protein [Paraburkholderia sp. JHI869]|uniref:T6SS immunity protein Tli4 family protein n=1 Tax=Paraburkholderia sp. JHI869 TaxID=3112959 RepID=UPI00317C66E0